MATNHANSDFSSASSILNITKPLGRFDDKPLDSTELYKDLPSAEEYAANDPHAYVGQYIAVKTGASTYDGYIIADAKGTLRRLSTSNVYFTEGNKGLTIKNTSDSSPAFLTFIGNGPECGIEFYANAETTDDSTNTGNLENRIGVIFATVDPDNTNEGIVDNSIVIKLGNIKDGKNVARFHTGGLNVNGEMQAKTFNNITFKQDTIGEETGAHIADTHLLLDHGISMYREFEENTAGFIHFYHTKSENNWTTADTISLKETDGKIYFNMTRPLDIHGDLIVHDVTDDKGTTSSSKVQASTFNATSDARLKENFQPLSTEKSILDLPTYKFDFINGSKNQIGCKAQDLQEICPEIVDEGNDGYLSIQESKIVYLLLEEVKKLRKEIDELKGV